MLVVCYINAAMNAQYRLGQKKLTATYNLFRFLLNNQSPPPKIPSADSNPGPCDTFSPGHIARLYPNSI